MMVGLAVNSVVDVVLLFGKRIARLRRSELTHEHTPRPYSQTIQQRV